MKVIVYSDVYFLAVMDSILRLKTCIIHSQRLGQSTDASCKDVMEQSAVKGLHQLSLILSTDVSYWLQFD